jgi:hypothetical protein
MAIVLSEKVTSREWVRGERPSLIQHYTLTGTSDDQRVAETLELESDAIWIDRQGRQLARSEIRYDPVWVDEDEDDGLWDCSITYELPEFLFPNVDDGASSFDIGGGTQNVTQSIVTVGAHQPGGGLPANFEGAIGVTHEQVEGASLIIPSYTFNETVVFPHFSISDRYRGTLVELVGTMNDRTFFGLESGECLFLGASGQRRGMGDWDITFKFAGSPNRSNIKIGTMDGISKLGWDYLWVRYADRVSTTSEVTSVVKKPIAVYVERVYRFGNFHRLGIGITSGRVVRPTPVRR